MNVYDLNSIKDDGDPTKLALHSPNHNLDLYKEDLDRWVDGNRYSLGLDTTNAYPFAGNRPADPVSAAPVPSPSPQPSRSPDVSTMPVPRNAAAFVESILTPVVQASRTYQIPVPVILAQAIVESRSGRSQLALQGNNLFGIKGREDAGSINLPTKEWIGGQYQTVVASFRRYTSWAASIMDHGRLLSGSRYRNAGIGSLTDPDQVAIALQRAGYATDPNYANLLHSVMEQDGLYGYASAGWPN